MRKNYSYLVIVLGAGLLAACAGQRPVVPGPPSPEKPVEVMGPVIPDSHVVEEQLPAQAYGPEAPPPVIPAPGATAPTGEPPKLCLVLGPGMAKAMAEAAVLEAIRKAKLPVHCVVGTEMGAIIGALYASSAGNTNNLQWQLFKLNKDSYFSFPLLSLREPKSSGRRLHEFLRGIFRDSRIETLPIRFATTAVDDENDAVVELDRGSIADALSASSAVPGIFESWKIGDNSFRSAVSADPAPIELAKKLGGNFIVLVDVLLDGGALARSRFHRAFTGSRSLVKLLKKDASFVIQVKSGAIPFDDFSRQGEILSAGADAAEKAMPELKAAWEKWVAGTH
jgi:NTE family protein